MDNGRFESLGRAIYRAFETDPKECGEAQSLTLEGLKKIRVFLEGQLPQKIKDSENCPPDVADARRQVVEDINEEIKWINEAIIWFNEGGMRREHFDLAQWEANKAKAKKA